jgi:hypothetical protein
MATQKPLASAMIKEDERCANATCRHTYAVHQNGGRCGFRTFGLNPKDMQCSCKEFEREPVKQRCGDVVLKIAILMALIFSPVCGGCPTTAKCPQDGGQADYDDSYEENGRIYCVYVHHVQAPRGPQDHRFRIACK